MDNNFKSMELVLPLPPLPLKKFNLANGASNEFVLPLILYSHVPIQSIMLASLPVSIGKGFSMLSCCLSHLCPYGDMRTGTVVHT